MAQSEPPADGARLCRILAALNCADQQTSISADSFSRPNFDLVCNILKWLVRIVGADRQQIGLAKPSRALARSRLPETVRLALLVSTGRRPAGCPVHKPNLVRPYLVGKHTGSEPA